MDQLVSRRDERAALDRLVADVLAAASRVVVLRGDAGAGKSAQLAAVATAGLADGDRPVATG